VTGTTFEHAAISRFNAAGVEVSAPQLHQLKRYYDLLYRWNQRINLTALPLENYPASTLDRLLVEPVVGATLVEDSLLDYFDLGSGGGSPAIPLAIVRPQLSLTMVESRERKAAFLRETIREVGLVEAGVLTNRFEDLADVSVADLVTVRAVKLDGALLSLVHRLLRPGGKLLVFGAKDTPPLFRPVEYCQLPSGSYLTMLVRQ